MESMPIVVICHEGCYRLKLNRLDKHNALNPEMIELMYQNLLQISNDQSARVLIIESLSDVFMVGGDIYYFSELLSLDCDKRVDVIKPMLDQAQAIIRLIASLSIPVIGVVCGVAAGYGLSLLLACDQVLALECVSFYSSYIGLGLTPDGGQLMTLKNIVGLKQAKKMLIFNEPLKADKAFQLGLVDYLYQSHEELNEKLQVLIHIAQKLPQMAAAKIKTQINDLEGLERVLEIEKDAFLAQIGSNEFVQGVKALIHNKNKHKK